MKVMASAQAGSGRGCCPALQQMESRASLSFFGMFLVCRFRAEEAAMALGRKPGRRSHRAEHLRLATCLQALLQDLGTEGDRESRLLDFTAALARHEATCHGHGGISGQA